MLSKYYKGISGHKKVRRPKIDVEMSATTINQFQNDEGIVDSFWYAKEYK